MMLGRRTKSSSPPAVTPAQAPTAELTPAERATRVEVELTKARQDLSIAQAARMAAQEAYDAAADGARLTEAAEAKAEISAAEIAVDIALRMIVRLEAELDELLAGAADAAAAAGRDRLRAAAVAALDAYRIAFGERMPALTESLRGLVRLWAEAELARAAAAAVGVALPGADDFRHRPGTPRVDLSRRTLDLWVNPHCGSPFDDDRQRRVRVRDDGVGILQGPGRVTEATKRQKFEEVTFQPLTVAQVAPALFEALVPCAAAGLPAGWSPMRGNASPRDVLAALDALAAREAAGPAPAPEPRTERKPIEPARDVRRNPNPAPFRAYRGPYGADAAAEAAST